MVFSSPGIDVTGRGSSRELLWSAMEDEGGFRRMAEVQETCWKASLCLRLLLVCVTSYAMAVRGRSSQLHLPCCWPKLLSASARTGKKLGKC